MLTRSDPPGPTVHGPSLVIGRYALYGEIAAGGMATVHFGRLLGPVGFSRTVALKRLHPQFAKDPEFVAMFLDEARLAARIRHPNVVPTLDVVAEHGELFLVMEYVQGESLSRLTRLSREQAQPPMPPTLVAAILANVLHGLHAAHEATDERGEPLAIVHRDVSPQNILVGVDGVARVLDFGVAKAAGRIQITREGRLKGKLAYMAPEHLLHGVVTRKTDIYAAGVVLWETLARKRLFDADNDYSLVEKVKNLVIEPPSRHQPGLPKAFDEVTLRGVARDPSQRFGTAREMAAALERCAGIAPATEVGEWVARTAREALARRTAEVAVIESGRKPEECTPEALSPVDPRGSVPPVTPLIHDPDDEALTIERRNHPLRAHHAELASRSLAGLSDESPSQQTSVTMSTPPGTADLRAPRKRGRVVVLAMVVGALAFAAFAMQVSRRPDVGASPVAAADSALPPGLSPPGSAWQVETPPTPPSAQTQAIEIALPPETASSPSDPAPTRMAGSRPHPPKIPPHAAPPPTSSSPQSAPNCDPPYTIDVQGIQRVKRECLGR
jgi:serine/threonine protein kinase